MDRKSYRVALAALGAQASLLHVELAVVGAGHEVDQVDVPVVLVPDEDHDDGDDDDDDDDDDNDDDDDDDNDDGGSCTGGTSAPTFFDHFDASASLRGLRRTSPLASRQSGIELRVSLVLEFRKKRTRGNVVRV